MIKYPRTIDPHLKGIKNKTVMWVDPNCERMFAEKACLFTDESTTENRAPQLITSSNAML